MIMITNAIGLDIETRNNACKTLSVAIHPKKKHAHTHGVHQEKVQAKKKEKKKELNRPQVDLPRHTTLHYKIIGATSHVCHGLMHVVIYIYL